MQLPNLSLVVTRPTSSSNEITLESKIGRGGFGTVFRCRDTFGTSLATKCITTDATGIPCLMEAAIMSTLYHPNLNTAVKIYVESTMVYIVQALAVSDLRKYRHNNAINLPLLIKWCYDLLQAVACLHQHKLIHGDIKASNVLVYANNEIKLADFTLATSSDWANSYKPCTSTHRPLEVWLGHSWDKSVDIWSLGCTFFELIYGRSLFAAQETNASINALIDWSNYTYTNNNNDTKKLTLPKRDDEGKRVDGGKRADFYHNYALPETLVLDNSLLGQVNQLIISMLAVWPQDRPTAEQLLQAPLFQQWSLLPLNVTTTTPTNIKLSASAITKISRFLKKVLPNADSVGWIQQLTEQLYSRIHNSLLNVSDALQIQTCAWMAHKLVTRTALPKTHLIAPLHEILQTERHICEQLNFLIF